MEQINMPDRKHLEKLPSFKEFCREVEAEFVRSGGKGGQKVNKTSSAAQVAFCVTESGVLTRQQKLVLIEKGLTDSRGNVRSSSESERSQLQNKQEALEKLYEKIIVVLTPPKKRVETTEPGWVRSLKERGKKHQSDKKKSRSRPDLD